MEPDDAQEDNVIKATTSTTFDRLSDPALESVERVLAAARGELDLDLADLTEFFEAPPQADGDGDQARLFDVPALDGSGVPYGTLRVAGTGAHPHLGERDVAFMRVLARVVGETVDRERAQKLQRERLERAVIDSRTHSLGSEAGLVSSEAEMVRRLALAVEHRDDDTGAHIHRVSRYAAHLAVLAGLSADQCELIRHSSPLHDAGKIAVPDAVLLKPGRLTPDERAIMETHAQVGYDLLRGSDSLVLQCAATLAWTHHEKYGGGGYPRRLSGDDIPIEGQILAIADVYDALSSDRIYRPAFPMAKVEEMMRADSGSHFNPALLEAFLTTVPELGGGR
jgi:response regulator RpfG family c-di-GMP phosphodiesterase